MISSDVAKVIFILEILNQRGVLKNTGTNELSKRATKILQQKNNLKNLVLGIGQDTDFQFFPLLPLSITQYSFLAVTLGIQH